MMKIARMSLRWLAGAVCAVSSIALAGAESTPTPRPTASPSPTPTPRAEGGKSLNRIAGDTKLKGGEDGKPIVISNETLQEMADEGSVTSAGGRPAARPIGSRPVRQGQDDAVVVRPDESLDTAERRNFWRTRYERQVDLINTLQQQIQRLDQEIPGLWRDFYSRDDPAYRDGVIKPKLDEYLARRQSFEQQLAEARPELDRIKSDARRDGAEPGWFRGIATPQPRPTSPPPAGLD